MRLRFKNSVTGLKMGKCDVFAANDCQQTLPNFIYPSKSNLR